jgi:transcriptional regulator with XRE-family HTH domain
VSELLNLIQAHLDRYGVTRSEFARRAGTTPQTVQNWKDRPTTLPRREHLEGVARVIGVPYEVVLNAALQDAGYSDGDLPMAARTEDRPKPKPE